MGIEVLKPGLCTSIQDLGRIGFGAFGVPKSGSMDNYAAKFANMLVGNSESEAVMEIASSGCSLKFHENMMVSIAGLDAEILLNNQKIPINESFETGKNTILEIKNSSKGNWVYLSVFGGFQTEKVMGSRSMYDGVTPQAKLKKGGFLEIEPFLNKSENSFSSVRFDEKRYVSTQIPVFPGPEFSLLSSKNQEELFQKHFTVLPDSSRMACLLEEKVKNKLKSILTGPILPGTVELTPGGQLIVLMRDAPVTGGYPRILQVSEEGLNCLAQKRSREKIKFDCVGKNFV